MNQIVERAISPTPPFWKKVRNIAIIVAAAAGGILAAPIALPATVSGILATLATIAGTIGGTAQFTVEK